MPEPTHPRDAARSSGDTLLDMVAVLIDAGATHTSAVRAAVAIENGRSYHDAYSEVELAAEPAAFDAQLLAAEITRARERVPAGSRA